MPEHGNLTRRAFVKRSAGIIGLLAVLPSPLMPVLSRVKALDGTAEAATAKKNRAWCMVIDLKKCEGCVTIDTPPQCK